MENIDSTLRLMMLVISGIFAISWLCLALAFRLIPKASASFFLANVSVGLGVILMLQRANHPGFLSFQVADWLVIFGLVTFQSGILRLLRDPPPSLWLRYMPLWIEIAATAALPPDTSSYLYRALAFNAIACITTCSGFIECVWGDGTHRFKGWVKVLIAWPFLGVGLLFGIRAYQVLAVRLTTGISPVDSTLHFTLFLWTFILLLVVTNISLVGLLVHALQKNEENLLLQLDTANTKLTSQLQMQTEQLQNTDSTLSQIRIDYEKAYPMARMAAVIPSITHDLNTSIGCSIMAASIIDESFATFEMQNPPDGRRSIERDNLVKAVRNGLRLIELSNQRTADLVSSLKQMSIDQATQQRRSFLVDELIYDVVATLTPALKKRQILVTFDMAPDLLMDSFPGPLGQVISNLVQNALLHGFDGLADGTITLRAQATDKSKIRIEVQDNGKGMTEAVRTQLFQAFFTTKPDKGGSGLGLTFSNRLIENVLGGKIMAQSKPGEGSRFIMELPRVTPTVAA
jgi:signal transduction histidine kinase